MSERLVILLKMQLKTRKVSRLNNFKVELSQVLNRKKNLEKIESDVTNEISQIELSNTFDNCKLKY